MFFINHLIVHVAMWEMCIGEIIVNLGLILSYLDGKSQKSNFSLYVLENVF